MGELWGIMGQLWLMYGELWEIMGNFGELWGFIGNYADLCQGFTLMLVSFLFLLCSFPQTCQIRIFMLSIMSCTFVCHMCTNPPGSIVGSSG